MISGSAMIECGTGSVVSLAFVNGDNGIGVVAMRSCPPEAVGISKEVVDRERFEKFMEKVEVLFCYHNVESLDVTISTFTRLREMMIEERERKNEEENEDETSQF